MQEVSRSLLQVLPVHKYNSGTYTYRASRVRTNRIHFHRWNRKSRLSWTKCERHTDGLLFILQKKKIHLRLGECQMRRRSIAWVPRPRIDSWFCKSFPLCIIGSEWVSEWVSFGGMISSLSYGARFHVKMDTLSRSYSFHGREGKIIIITRIS